VTTRLAVLALAACGQPAASSCADDLHGVYAAGGERWMVLDNGATLEAYPLFPDAAGPPELVVAPRVIELARVRRQAGVEIDGTVRRRYMRRAEPCDAQLPVHVIRCAGGLEIELAEPSPPLAFSPCSWPPQPAPRTVRWQRE
jgi:hypothetical protein